VRPRNTNKVDLRAGGDEDDAFGLVLVFFFLACGGMAGRVASSKQSSNCIEVNNCTVVHTSGEKRATQILIELYKRRGLIRWKKGAARHMFWIGL
jgi:hypothetical protein